jgi:hypothetical protein
MKQIKFMLLTFVVVIFAGAALTHAEAPRTRSHHKNDPSLVSAAMQRWRMGGTTHWRSMLMQR